MTALTTVCDEVGITYRQADYWIREGLVNVACGANGPGSRRDITDVEMANFSAMAQLIEQGLIPSMAAFHARRLLVDGLTYGDLVRLDVTHQNRAKAAAS